MSTVNEGSVWRVTFVKVQSGKGNEYLRLVGPVRARLMDEARKAGLVLSHKMFNGLASGPTDWDFLFMVEYRNWAAIDGMRDKLDAINRAVLGTEEKVLNLVDQRSVVREIIGEKFVQELHFG